MAEPDSGILLLVNEFEFDEKIEEIDENRTQIGTVVVTDGVSSDPKLAAYIAARVPYAHSQVREIDRAATKAIAKMALESKVYESEQFVVCVCLNHAPYIGIILDRGSFKERDDQFDKDVAREAAQKTDTHIPIVFANPNIPFSALIAVDL